MKDFKDMNTQEANAAIAEKLEAANKAIQEAQEIADFHNIGFRFEGPDYGMGGWYESGDWNASSQSC